MPVPQWPWAPQPGFQPVIQDMLTAYPWMQDQSWMQSIPVSYPGYTPPGSVPAEQGIGAGYGGMYQPQLNQVYVDNPNNLELLLHELAHGRWETMPVEQKLAFYQSWLQSNLANREAYPGVYEPYTWRPTEWYPTVAAYSQGSYNAIPEQLRPFYEGWLGYGPNQYGSASPGGPQSPAASWYKPTPNWNQNWQNYPLPSWTDTNTYPIPGSAWSVG